jgi:hypothetical protein
MISKQTNRRKQQRRAAARVQLLKEKEKWKRVSAVQAALVNAKIQWEKHLEESSAAKEEMEARVACNNEEAAKHKVAYSSRHYFLESPLRAENKVDPLMASPNKKKQKKTKGTLKSVIEIDMDTDDDLEAMSPACKVHRSK